MYKNKKCQKNKLDAKKVPEDAFLAESVLLRIVPSALRSVQKARDSVPIEYVTERDTV